MGLQVSPVHRNLEGKIKIAGMEAYSLFCVLIFASIMDLIFGHTPLRPYLVFALPGALVAILFFVNRGRPPNYLLYLIRYHCTPGKYSAGVESKDEWQRKRRITHERA